MSSIAEKFNLAANRIDAAAIMRDHLQARGAPHERAYALGRKHGLSSIANDVVKAVEQPSAPPESPIKAPETQSKDGPKDKGDNKAANSLGVFIEELKRSGF